MDLPYIPIVRPTVPKKSNLKLPLVGTLVVFLLVLGLFGFNVIKFKEQAERTGPVVYNNFKAGAAALFNFDLGKAKSSFQQASDDLAKLNQATPLKTVPAVLDNLFKVSQSAVILSSSLEDLKKNGLAMVVNKQGFYLIKKLHDIQNLLQGINALGDKLKNQAANIGYNSDQEFSGLNAKLNEADQFLSAFIGWLEAPKKQRLVVMFQNPSEIRPSGGFIGSYAIATLFQGNLLDMETRDIYDPDGQLDLKIIPPKPLQGVTDKWGARDANWFFDFPTSAKKVLEFLEASKIYSEQGIRFSGAVAVNVGVILDLLEVVGPLELKDYGLTIDSSNFLPEIQREVESGQDKARGEPKRIIKVLAPMIFAELSKLNEDQKSSLLDKLAKRIQNKDMMVYFKDPVIESYAKELGAGGETFVLPQHFVGEYLAVVNANVAGGKSDALIEQQIKLSSTVDGSGSVHNILSITRKHNGANEKDWWYRSTNRDYLQAYVTPGSVLVKTSGGTDYIVKPIISYTKSGFAKDQDLVALESGSDFGKTVLASWFNVKAGSSGKLSFTYDREKVVDLSKLGPYRVIFEKQSGVGGSLEIDLEAPEGFQWKESGSRDFKYSSADLSGRIVLDLNLEAVPR
ncbi:MAG: DUF4012 domain-containing protein [bacterium]|nr:DUF4012 domain-containing protein [bacterium]